METVSFNQHCKTKQAFHKVSYIELPPFFDIGFSVEVSEIPLGLKFCFLHNSKWICFTCCTGLIS